MNNSLVLLKFKQRINKLDSSDYDNILPWQIREAFNKGQRQWVRRQLEGINQTKTGKESTLHRIADLQVLLKTYKEPFFDKGLYWESCSFPDDYMEFSRVSAKAPSECCPDRMLIIYPGTESDVDIWLQDPGKKPNYEWGETFYTIFGDKIRIYTNGDFGITSPEIIYYRQPKNIAFVNVVDEDGNVATADIECEFKDDVVELIIDEAVAIISGDLDRYDKHQAIQQSVEMNN